MKAKEEEMQKGEKETEPSQRNRSTTVMGTHTAYVRIQGNSELKRNRPYACPYADILG